MLKQGVRASGMNGGAALGPHLEASIDALDISARGLFSLEQGFLFTALILGAMTAEIIDRRFSSAAIWASAAAVLSWFGFMHAYAWGPGDTVANIGWGTGAAWAVAYVATAVFLALVPWCTRREL